MRLIFIHVFLLIIFGSACVKPAEGEASGSGKLNGPKKYYYADGTLYLEGTYVDSVPHGIFKQYHKNGNIYEEANYVKGLLQGVVKRYYEDGKLMLEIPYDSGRVHGIQKKYRREGNIMYEAPYHYDVPCKGLKEYYTSGKPVEKLPRIVITEEDNMWSDNRFTLKLSIDNGMKAEFYKGELTDGLYIGSRAEKIYVERDGVGRIDYYVPRGLVVMENINIIAKVKSDLKNFYIIQRPYNVAVQNR